MYSPLSPKRSFSFNVPTFPAPDWILLLAFVVDLITMQIEKLIFLIK